MILKLVDAENTLLQQLLPHNRPIFQKLQFVFHHHLLGTLDQKAYPFLFDNEIKLVQLHLDPCKHGQSKYGDVLVRMNLLLVL